VLGLVFVALVWVFLIGSFIVDRARRPVETDREQVIRMQAERLEHERKEREAQDLLELQIQLKALELQEKNRKR